MNIVYVNEFLVNVYLIMKKITQNDIVKKKRFSFISQLQCDSLPY